MSEKDMAFEIDIQERMIQFAARIIKFCETMPKTMAGNQISSELLRSSLTPAAYYSRALNAPDASDFITDLLKVVKDLNESEVWLRIVVSGNVLPKNKVTQILDECHQLQRLVQATIKTARETAE